MKKVNEYDFTDKALLPSHYRFASTNGFNMQDGVVADTPQGLKASKAIPRRYRALSKEKMQLPLSMNLIVAAKSEGNSAGFKSWA